MAKKKKKNSFDLITCIMTLVIVTILACVSNFGTALQEPFGSVIISMNIVSTILVLGIWAYNAYSGGRAHSKGFLILTLVWWGGGIGLIKLVDIAMSVNSDILYNIGFYGLLLIAVPTYALIPLSMMTLHIDYFMCYPAILVVLLGIYLLGWKAGEKELAAKALRKAMKEGKQTPAAEPADPAAVPEAAIAAAEAMRAAAAEKAAAEQKSAE